MSRFEVAMQTSIDEVGRLDDAAADEFKVTPEQAWIGQTLEHDRIMTRCRFSPCGRFLFAGGQHEDLQRWELDTGERTPLVGHRSWIGDLAFHKRKEWLYSGDFHGSLICWSTAGDKPAPVWKKPAAHEGWIRALLTMSDGVVLSAGNDRVVRQWTGDRGERGREFGGHGHYVFSLAGHPGGQEFVSGDLLGEVRAWDLESGKLQRTFDASPLHTRKDNFLADVGGVRAIAFNPSGTLLACGGMTDAKSNAFCPGKPAVMVFDWKSGKLMQTLRPQHTSDGPVKGLVFLDDSRLAAHAEHLNGVSSLEFWDVEESKSFHVLKRQSGYCLDLHPDGRRLAAATFKNNGRGGNGRHSTPKTYTTHDGEIAILHLFPKSDEKQPA